MEKKKRSADFWRFAAFLVVLFGIFVWLVSGLVSLQLRQSDELMEKATDTRTKTIALRGKRGNITTSDSVVMAEDVLIYNVTFQKDVTDNTKALYQKYTASILETIDIVEKNGGSIAVSFVIRRNEKTKDWEFFFGSGVSESVLETREKQWRSNNYLTDTDRYGTAQQCIDKLRDTASSHERCSVIEVMGRHAGWIALNVGIATGAESILIPEVPYDFNKDVLRVILDGRNTGKKHYIVIVAEGVGHADEIARQIEEATGIEARPTILGHLQRGGSPTLRDRTMASLMGIKAIDCLIEKRFNRLVCRQHGEITDVDIEEGLEMTKTITPDLIANAKRLG